MNLYKEQLVRYHKFIWMLLLVMNISNSFAFQIKNTDKPNVILVITDDQGYGDLACLGNPVIKTPHLDDFFNESIRLTDFHVGPTCAPTRAGLMTGRYANRTGVWHTIGGCSILREKEKTVANVFQDNGYETGMFGKWHLGDNYPSRPQDKGFKYVVANGGGGVGQTPDYWGNDYFDDTYLVNGKAQKFEGYCTDVWFDEAIKYVKENKDSPFFCYISTNAPHSPYNVPAKYYDLYKNEDLPETQKRFYGMITNIDDNFNRLKKELKKLKLEKNTIIIFMTDNGTAAGYKEFNGKISGYNAGMRGIKGSEYDGGHRVPLFISYPAGNIGGGKDIDNLTANIDILPTLASLCNMEYGNFKVDGKDLSQLLKGKLSNLNRDYVITDSQRLQEPVKWRRSAVMTPDYFRLINGEELYDISEDPGQENNIAVAYPGKVEKLRSYYEEWWKSVSKKFSEYPVIKVGEGLNKVSKLTCHDSHIKNGHIPWNQNHIREGEKNPFGGFYELEFAKDGMYEIILRRWPSELDKPINQGLDNSHKKTLNTEAIPQGKAFNFVEASVKIGGWENSKEVKKDDAYIVFKDYFPKGKHLLKGWFTTNHGEYWGVYYMSVQRIK